MWIEGLAFLSSNLTKNSPVNREGECLGLGRWEYAARSIKRAGYSISSGKYFFAQALRIPIILYGVEIGPINTKMGSFF
jgi:hypothetical protein